ncbi:MAG: hypothetical protein ABID45_00305 [Patescibacteria group bacterium]
MSKFLLFSKLNCKNRQNPKKIGKVFNLVNKSKGINILIVVLIIGFGILYIGTVNTTADLGFEVDDLKNRAQQLAKDNQKLELEIAADTSMQNIKRASEDLDLVQISEAQYISEASAMALGE